VETLEILKRYELAIFALEYDLPGMDNSPESIREIDHRQKELRQSREALAKAIDQKKE